MIWYAVRAIYFSELARSRDDGVMGFVAPVISTSLYFIVFGSINTGATPIGAISYSAFLVPGMVMLTLIVDTVINAAIGIFVPKESGAIYEILASPISAKEIVLGYGGATLTKAGLLGMSTLAVAKLIVEYKIAHPIWMIGILLSTALTCSMFGLIVGIWAKGFRQLIAIPALVLTPLIFFSGVFYSLEAVPPSWKAITYANPIVYIVGAFRWSFNDVIVADLGACALVMAALMFLCFAVLWAIFRTGYKLRS